ncbi:MAG: HEPN domain-containing protein [Solirubrobacterales bacterium]
MRRPGDWLRQAELDLDAARGAAEQSRFEWTCFIAQQAAEKAVKAVHEAAGTEAWGHSVAGLLAGLDLVPADVVDAGKALDRHYVPTRYPNAQPEGAPGDLYTERDASLALEDATKVIEHARGRIQDA